MARKHCITQKPAEQTLEPQDRVTNDDALTHFPTGAVRDVQDGKEDLIEGISWVAEKRFARYMDGKAAKYGRGNWKKGIPPEQALKSLARHFQKFVSEWEYGICEEHDDHLSAMRFNLNLLMHELELIRMGRGRFEASREYAALYPEYEGAKEPAGHHHQ